MNPTERFTLAQEDYHNWLCPDLTAYWQLGKVKNSDQVLLKAKEYSRCYQFSAREGYALRYFSGQFTIAQVQNLCQQQFKDAITPNFILQLLEKLLTLGIIALPDSAVNSQVSTNAGPKLKLCVQWIHHPENYWILRNPEDVTFLQVSDRDRDIISRLGQLPPKILAQEYNLSLEELQYLLQILAATGMLEGTKPAKPPKRKFTPLQLLYFKLSLFNPDPWLSKHINKIRWIWTSSFACLLCLFIGFSALIGFNQQSDILFHGQQLWSSYKSSLLLPFGLLTMLVVTLHELGHAFTLKNFGGIVPEVGLLFMLLMPSAYTNTTDAYCLVKRRQRVLVVAAGVLVQFTIAAGALWLWNFSGKGTWLHNTSYLLMVAALFTVALNLNPLSKFDGYYLAVALTGINNLRSRSFSFYRNLLTGKPIQEAQSNCWILASYAPFSLAYIYFVFGFLLFTLADWSLTNIPAISICLLTIWLIYFYFPTAKDSQ